MFQAMLNRLYYFGIQVTLDPYKEAIVLIKHAFFFSNRLQFYQLQGNHKIQMIQVLSKPADFVAKLILFYFSLNIEVFCCQ